MKIHIDWPWASDVRKYGVPVRAYVHLKNWTVLVGKAKAQAWNSETGWGDEYRRITWHPKKTCRLYLENQVRCPLKLGHHGRCYNWERKMYQIAA